MELPINTRAINIPDEIVHSWQSIVDTLADTIHVPAALIMKADRPYIEVFRSSQSGDNPYEVGNREHLAGLYCERVITTKERLLVPNALKDPDWVSNPDVKRGMISYLGFPLLWPNGEVFGTICVLDAKENRYSEVYERLLLQFRELVEAHLRLLYRERELERVIAERPRAQESKGAGEVVRLWVEDNGIGIAPEYHERIFRVFERLHDIEAYPGTGIGLAIVRKGAERMGGRVGVESEVGKGSRFWVELPRP